MELYSGRHIPYMYVFMPTLLWITLPSHPGFMPTLLWITRPSHPIYLFQLCCGLHGRHIPYIYANSVVDTTAVTFHIFMPTLLWIIHTKSSPLTPTLLGEEGLGLLFLNLRRRAIFPNTNFLNSVYQCKNNVAGFTFFNSMNCIGPNSLSLKYRRLTPPGCNDLKIRRKKIVILAQLFCLTN